MKKLIAKIVLGAGLMLFCLGCGIALKEPYSKIEYWADYGSFYYNQELYWNTHYSCDRAWIYVPGHWHYGRWFPGYYYWRYRYFRP